MVRKAIKSDVARLLWAKSGGYCQNPNCNADLFHFFEDGTISSIQELAHIVAQSAEGPRGSVPLSAIERDRFDNMLMLCPSCHKLIDKNPSRFPAEELHRWKSEHEDRIATLFSAPVFKDRAELDASARRIMLENKSYFDEYGPESPHAAHLLTDAVTMWRSCVLSIIIPNNRKLLQLLRANYRLLSPQEQEVVERFAVHKNGFEYNHLSGEKNSSVPLFPSEMNSLFRERTHERLSAT